MVSHHVPYLIGSMYAIYGNIYHQYTPNVSIYTIHGSYGFYGYRICDRSAVPARCIYSRWKSLCTANAALDLLTAGPAEVGLPGYPGLSHVLNSEWVPRYDVTSCNIPNCDWQNVVWCLALFSSLDQQMCYKLFNPTNFDKYKKLSASEKPQWFYIVRICYPLVNIQKNDGKPPLFMGKSTISTGPCSIANC